MKLKNKYFIYIRYEKTGSKTLIREIFNKYFHYHSLSSLDEKLFDKFIDEKEKKFQNQIFVINVQLQKNIVKEKNIIFDIITYYKNIFRFLRYIYDKYNFKLILGIRTQKEIMESYYTQLAKNGYYITRKKFYKSHYKIWMYSYIINEIFNIYLKKDVYVFILNKTTLNKDFQGLYYFISNKNKKFKNILRYNFRRSNGQVTLYMFFNFLRLRGVKKIEHIPQLEKIIYVLGKLFDKIVPKTNKKNYYKDFLILYKEDNKKIEKKFKLDLQLKGFDL